MIPLLALTLQRISRSRAILLFCIVLIAAAAVTLPIFAPHPIAHLFQQLNQNATKLRYVPSALHPRWTLPLLALLITGIAFFIRMDLPPRLFLIFSVTSFVMLAPFAITFALHSEKLRYNLSYLGICALSFALWALSQYEPAGCPIRTHPLRTGGTQRPGARSALMCPYLFHPPKAWCPISSRTMR